MYQRLEEERTRRKRKEDKGRKEAADKGGRGAEEEAYPSLAARYHGAMQSRYLTHTHDVFQ